MALSLLKESLTRLENFVLKENFRGYDPYDVLNSSFPFRKFGKWGQVIPIQIQKRNPINVRPIIGIRKGINPKAMGLFLKAYCILFELTNEQIYADRASYLFNWLIKNYSEGFSGICWGYNFDWASPVKVLKAYSPTIVATGFVSNGIFEYYRVFKSEEAKNTLLSIEKFLGKDLFWFEDESGKCVSYSTLQPDCCYNASMLGAAFYAKLGKIMGSNKFLIKSKELVDFVVSRQKEDGRWNYSIEPKTGKERVQIDFHQGYILDTLNEFIVNSNQNDRMYGDSLNKGLTYYRQNQFLNSGQSIWRVPKKWPVEIHNQSQGIITFSQKGHLFENYYQFAEKIALWTIKNMQGKNGAFYYKIYPTHKIKIPYMRWAQAWMFLAITQLMAIRSKE